MDAGLIAAPNYNITENRVSWLKASSSTRTNNVSGSILLVIEYNPHCTGLISVNVFELRYWDAYASSYLRVEGNHSLGQRISIFSDGMSWLVLWHSLFPVVLPKGAVSSELLHARIPRVAIYLYWHLIVLPPVQTSPQSSKLEWSVFSITIIV
jgi:hypothetical protein